MFNFCLKIKLDFVIRTCTTQLNLLPILNPNVTVPIGDAQQCYLGYLKFFISCFIVNCL